MRVGIDARVLAEITPRGVSRYLSALLRAAAELEPQHEYVLYLRKTPLTESPFTTAPFHQRVLPGNVVLNSPFIWQQMYLPWQVWRDGIDVLFSPYYCGPLISPVPHVVFIADISFSVFPHDFPSWVRFKPKLLAKPVSRRAARIVTISQFSRQEIIQAYGIEPEKVIVAAPGSEEQLWKRSNSIGREKSSIFDGKVLFLFVGSLLPRRQVGMVIKALAQLPQDYHLIIVGETDPVRSESLMVLARRWRVEDRVYCLGYISDTELEDMYQRAVALVSPSTYEGFSLPTLEALSRGLPVIAWDIPVMREVAADVALLLSIGDVEGLAAAMGKIASDASLRQTLSQAGKDRVKQFSWQQAAAVFLTLLCEVVNKQCR